MPYDEGLAQRIHEYFSDRHDVAEKKMFGGLAFMVSGHMCCGIVNDTLMVRVGPDKYASALKQPHAREMDFTGKPMKGLLYVDPAGLESDADLERWLQAGLDFVQTLPPKKPKTLGK